MWQIPSYDAGTAAIRIKPSFRGFVEDAKAQLERMDFKVDVTMGLDTAAARTELDAFRTEANRNASMRVDVDTASARTDLDELHRSASRNASMRIDADTAAARAEIEALRQEARRGATITPTLSGSGAKSAASKLSGDLKSVLTLQAKVIGVVGAAGLVADLLAIAGAAAKASHALALIPAVGFGGLAGLGSVAVGAHGIGGAFKAFSEQSTNSTSNANDAIDKANAVSEARYAEAQADRSATTAQKELTDSYKDAGRELRDLNDQLQDQKLSTEDAALSVEEAAKRLAQVQHDPSADAATRQRADLTYRQAVQRLKEQQQKTSDLSQDTAQANAKGIEGSDKVTAAKEKVLSATHDQVKAEQDLAKAIRDQSQGSSSDQAVAKAMAKLSPNAKELVNDIRALGPSWKNAREAAQDALTNGMGGAVTKLAKEQLPGLKTGMVGINTAVNSGLRATLASLSSETNKADFKTSLANVAAGFQNAAKGAGPLTDALTKLITVGTDFLPKMGENFARFAGEFNNKVQVGAANGSLKKWIQEGIDAAKTFFGILRDVGSVVASVFRAADADQVSKSLKGASDNFAAFLKSGEGQGKLRAFFAEARADLDRIKPLLADIPKLLSGVYQGFQTWSAIATPFLKVAGDLLGAHPGLVKAAVAAYLAFKTLGPIFAGVRGQITDTSSVLNRFSRGAGAVNGAIDRFGTASVGAFTTLRTGLTSAFGTLRTGSATLFTALRTDAAGTFRAFGTGVAGVVSATNGVANVAGVGAVSMGRFGSVVQQLGTHIPVIGRMQTSFLNAAASADTFGRTAGVLAATGLTPAANGIRNAAGALTNAGSSLVSALGGPWIIAITAATLGIAKATSDMKAHEERVRAVAEAWRTLGAAQNDSAAAFANGGDGMSNVTEQVQLLDQSISKAADNKTKWSDWRALTQAPWNDNIKNENWNADQYDAARKAIEKLGLSQKAVSEAMVNDGAWADMKAKLEGQGKGGRFAAENYQWLRDTILKARDVARDTTPGFTDLTAAVKTLSDTSASGADRLSALKNALDVLAGKSLSAQDALARYNDQVRQTAELTSQWDAAQGTGQQLLDGDKVNTGTANGRKLYDTLKQIRDATADAAIAGNDLGPIMAKNEDQFKQLAHATGLDVTVIENLAAGIGYLPKDIKILASLQGANDVKQQLTVINEELQTHKDGVTIPVNALTKEARAELEKLKLVEPVPGKPDEIHVIAHTADALAQLQQIIDKKLPDKEQKINLKFGDLDDVQINVKARGALNPGSGDLTTVTGGHVGGRATGGQLPTTGPGTEKRDGILAVTGAGVPVARVDGGEWVINRQSSQKYGTELAQINAGTFRQLPGHEDGGVIGDDKTKTPDTTKATVSHVSELISYAQSRNGNPYGGAEDCSGYQSELANVSVGRDPGAGRFSTANEGEYLSALGFKTGVGNSSTFRIGWINSANMAAGGHTAGTLPNGVNVESGGATSKVMYGGQAIGASDNMFNQRAYLVMDSAGGSGAYVPGTSTPGATTYNPSTSTVVNPQAALPGKVSDTQLTIEQNKAAVDTANSERNAVYANPASTDADKKAADRKYQQAQNTLESSTKKDDNSSLSLKGIFTKAAGYFADAILSGFGLENSIFSENNVYNKAASSLYNHFNNTGTGGYSYTPQNLPTIVTTSTPQSDAPVTDPSLAGQVPAADTTTAGAKTHSDGVEKWRSTFASVLSALGKPSSWLEPGLSQMQTESGGNQYAVNDNDTDGKGGTQTVKGLMQMLDATYASYRSAQFGGGIFDGASNIAASIQYTAARYGDATTVWGQGHGYADGGRIPGVGGKRSDGIPIWASPDEFVVNAYDATRNSDALEAINQGRWSPVSLDPSQMINRGSSSNSGGTQFITNVNEPRVADVRDLADLVERQAHIKSMGQLAAVG